MDEAMTQDLEGDDPEPEYTEEDLELTAEDKQILEEIRGDPVSADVIPRPYVDEEESA